MNEYTPLEHTALRTFIQIESDSDKSFSASEITKLLGLTPFRTFDKGTMSPLWRLPCSFSMWCGAESVSSDDENVPNLNTVISKTIDFLIGKESALASIREKYDATVRLMVVPTILSGIPPELKFDVSILKFCADNNIIIDFEMYICPFDPNKK